MAGVPANPHAEALRSSRSDGPRASEDPARKSMGGAGACVRGYGKEGAVYAYPGLLGLLAPSGGGRGRLAWGDE